VCIRFNRKLAKNDYKSVQINMTQERENEKNKAKRGCGFGEE
jgi:hypothetical protein